MRDRIVKILVFILPLLVWSIWNIWWISNNYEYTGHDVVSHLHHERDVYSRIVSEFKYSGFVEGLKLLFQLPQEGLNWPFLTYTISALLELLIGGGLHSVFYTNLLFSYMVIFSVIIIAKKIDSFSAALYSFLILLFTPAFIGHTRFYGLDLPLCSFYIFTLMLLILMIDRRSVLWFVLLGLVIGTAILIRTHFILYISLPFIAFAIAFYKRHGIRDSLKILIPLIMCLISLIYWFGGDIEKVQRAYSELLVHLGRDYFFRGYTFPYETGLSPFTLDWFLYYPKVFIVNSGIFNFLIFAISIFSIFLHLIRSKRFDFPLMLLVCSFIWIYIILTLMSSKVPRYFFIQYPVAALISGIGISKYGNRAIKAIAVAGIILSIGFAVSMSHIKKFDLAIKGYLYNNHKRVAELWLGVPQEKENLLPAKEVSRILQNLSYKKPYPSINAIYISQEKENEPSINVFYSNFFVNLRNSLLPWLSHRIQDLPEFDVEYFRSKAMFPIFIPPFKMEYGCFTDIVISISDKKGLAREIFNKSRCDYRMLYQSILKPMFEGATMAWVEVYATPDLSN